MLDSTMFLLLDAWCSVLAGEVDDYLPLLMLKRHVPGLRRVRYKLANIGSGLLSLTQAPGVSRSTWPIHLRSGWWVLSLCIHRDSSRNYSLVRRGPNPRHKTKQAMAAGKILYTPNLEANASGVYLLCFI